MNHNHKIRSVLTTVVLALGLPSFGFAQSLYPEPDLRMKEGDWLVECYGPESRNGNCQLYQRVLMNNATVIAMVFTVAYSPDGRGLFLQMALPLGSNLSAGARVTFGNAFDKNIPFSRCTDQGCIVEGEITPSLLQAMRVTSAGFIGVETGAGPLNIPISMNGFSAGIDRIAPISVPSSTLSTPSLELPVEEPEATSPELAPVTGN